MINILKSFITKNRYYTAERKMTVKGLMLHSIGCPQPRAEVIKNNQNTPAVDKAVHAVIDGNTGDVLQILPWDTRAAHAGGKANNTHIGIEMCEPSCIKYKINSDRFTCSDVPAAREVAERTYKTAVELFAYLCELFKLDPLADGVIIGHAEGHARGVASNHGDPAHLWEQLGMSYTMETFRKAVKAEIEDKHRIYYVRIGTFKNVAYAENQLNKAVGLGFTDAFIEEKKVESEINGVTIEMPVLKRGDKGETVKTLQRLLNGLGFDDANEKALKTDGSFGPATLYALKSFQQEFGIEINGVCDKNTWTVLLNGGV